MTFSGRSHDLLVVTMDERPGRQSIEMRAAHAQPYGAEIQPRKKVQWHGQF